MQTMRQRKQLIMMDHKNVTSRHEIKYPFDSVSEYYLGVDSDDETYNPFLPFIIGVSVGLTLALGFVLWTLSK